MAQQHPLVQPGWQQLLGQIGLNVATINEICEQGLTSTDVTRRMSEHDIEGVRISVLKWPSPNRPAGAVVVFPYTALLRLWAIRYWTWMRVWQGLATDPLLCTPQELMAVESRYSELAELKKSSQDTVPQVPEKLKTFKEWITWKAAFDSYMDSIRGACDQPLTYLYREVATVDAATRAKTYATWDEHMHHCIVLQGHHFDLDNRRLWIDLKMLTVDGIAWNYIKEFDATANGRGAMLKLIQENASNSGMTIRKSRAYAALSSLTYNGPKRTWTFENYVTGHLHAHNELKDCGEEPPESKKVTDFLAGINDSTLTGAVQMCGAHRDYNESFTATQQFLSAIAANQKVSDGRKRARGVASINSNGNVGALGGSERSKRRRPNFKKERRPKNVDGPPATGITLSATASYSPDVWWNQFNQEQRDHVMKLREKNSRSSVKNRGVSSFETEDHDEQDTSEKPLKNAGTQFGRGAHKKKHKPDE